MNIDDRQRQKAERASYSYRAGFTFGCLIHQNNLDWTQEQINQFSAKLRPKVPLLKSHYKQGFHDAFLRGTTYTESEINGN